MANVNNSEQIRNTVSATYIQFTKTRQLDLTGEEYEAVRNCFRAATASAQNLQKHIFYSGTVATASLTISLVSSFFSKRYPKVNTISTLFLVGAIGSAAWFAVHYIRKQNLQKLFYDAVARRESGSAEGLSNKQLDKVIEVIQGGCVPKLSVTDINGEPCSLLGACMAKGSYETAILIAAMYEDQKELAADAKASIPFIKGDRFKNDQEGTLIAVTLLKCLGATIDQGDNTLLIKSASLLNTVAIEVLIDHGVKKDGGLEQSKDRKKAPMEYAIDSAIIQKRRVEDLLKVFGVTDYSKYTTKEALANYLNGEGVLISDDYAQKILTLLNASRT